MSKKRIQKLLYYRSSVKTLAIKCYDEQMPNGWDEVKKCIRNWDKEDAYVLGICHNRDLIGDNIWVPSNEKVHYHIIVKMMKCGSDGKIMPKKISTILNALGIVFRPDVDDLLWKNRGIETTDDFVDYTVYLTHDTVEAEKDGKEHYELNEIVSNLSEMEIRQLRDGYIRVTGKVGIKELARLDKIACEIGYKLMDFNEWYEELSFEYRCNLKIETVEKSYYKGVRKRVENNGIVNRLSIFISGAPNAGKTYAIKRALERMGVMVVDASGQRTGQFDDILPSTGGLIVSDDKVPNLLNLADNYICKVYRRNSNNPFWCGEYFIVSSNKSFREWARECGLTSKEIDALESRFFICEVLESDDRSIRRLNCVAFSNRGNPKEQEERKARFIKFKDYLHEEFDKYNPNDNTVDYSNLNDGILEEIDKRNQELERQKQIKTLYEMLNSDGFDGIEEFIVTYLNALDLTEEEIEQERQEGKYLNWHCYNMHENWFTLALKLMHEEYDEEFIDKIP